MEWRFSQVLSHESAGAKLCKFQILYNMQLSQSAHNIPGKTGKVTFVLTLYLPAATYVIC